MLPTFALSLVSNLTLHLVDGCRLDGLFSSLPQVEMADPRKDQSRDPSLEPWRVLRALLTVSPSVRGYIEISALPEGGATSVLDVPKGGATLPWR